jgi:hypothetical protein
MFDRKRCVVSSLVIVILLCLSVVVFHVERCEDMQVVKTLEPHTYLLVRDSICRPVSNIKVTDISLHDGMRVFVAKIESIDSSHIFITKILSDVFTLKTGDCDVDLSFRSTYFDIENSQCVIEDNTVYRYHFLENATDVGEHIVYPIVPIFMDNEKMFLFTTETVDIGTYFLTIMCIGIVGCWIIGLLVGCWLVDYDRTYGRL